MQIIIAYVAPAEYIDIGYWRVSLHGDGWGGVVAYRDTEEKAQVTAQQIISDVGSDEVIIKVERVFNVLPTIVIECQLTDIWLTEQDARELSDREIIELAHEDLPSLFKDGVFHVQRARHGKKMAVLPYGAKWRVVGYDKSGVIQLERVEEER